MSTWKDAAQSRIPHLTQDQKLVRTTPTPHTHLPFSSETFWEPALPQVIFLLGVRYTGVQATEFCFKSFLIFCFSIFKMPRHLCHSLSLQQTKSLYSLPKDRINELVLRDIQYCDFIYTVLRKKGEYMSHLEWNFGVLKVRGLVHWSDWQLIN